MSDKDQKYYAIAGLLVFTGYSALTILLFIWLGWWALLPYVVVGTLLGRSVFRQRFKELEAVFDVWGDLPKQ